MENRVVVQDSYSRTLAQTLAQTLEDAALGLSGVERGVACAGTALESATFKVKGKAFLFLRPETVMLKLDASLSEASKLAAEKPELYKVGSGAWVTISLVRPQELSAAALVRWVAESHGLFCATAGKPAKQGAKGK